MRTYNIGDKVWYAGRKSIQERITCPECFGKRYLTVILGDDSKVTIDCAGCASGYDPPKGYILYHKQIINVSQITIDGMEISPKEIKYKYNYGGCSWNVAYHEDVFSSQEAAEIRAKELAEEHNKQEHERIHRKEKNNRTWSWHVHYYRKMIRDAKKTIERAEEKLGIAKTKQSQGGNSNENNHSPKEK